MGGKGRRAAARGHSNKCRTLFTPFWEQVPLPTRRGRHIYGLEGASHQGFAHHGALLASRYAAINLGALWRGGRRFISGEPPMASSVCTPTSFEFAPEDQLEARANRGEARQVQALARAVSASAATRIFNNRAAPRNVGSLVATRPDFQNAEDWKRRERALHATVSILVVLSFYGVEDYCMYAYQQIMALFLRTVYTHPELIIAAVARTGAPLP